MRLIASLAFAIAITFPAHAAQPPANPANCKNTADFQEWLAAFKAEAASESVSQSTIQSALGGMQFAPDIVGRDRGQKIFAVSFVDFSAKLATPNRQQKAKQAVVKYKDIFDRAEQEYGVPPTVIAAFWALESDFGVGMGKLAVLRSLATLAYDCRRPALFRPELMAALKLIDRGDFRAGEMIGSWAGELGQTQFLPSLYLKYATDGDGDGKADLLRDPADIIVSTAKYIADLGWRRGEPWIEEVRVPAELAWDQADLTIEHQRGKWADWGVTKADGSPLQRDGVPASLLLPMGRNGPAFLTYANFKQVYLQWNESLTYSLTAAYLATRVEGAGQMRRGNGPVTVLSNEDAKQVQRLLVSNGFDVGKIDGTIGAKTRAAVKAMQIKFGQPPDSYPTPELLAALGGRASPSRVATDDTGGEAAARPAPRPKPQAQRKRPPRQQQSDFPFSF